MFCTDVSMWQTGTTEYLPTIPASFQCQIPGESVEENHQCFCVGRNFGNLTRLMMALKFSSGAKTLRPELRCLDSRDLDRDANGIAPYQ